MNWCVNWDHIHKVVDALSAIGSILLIMWTVYAVHAWFQGWPMETLEDEKMDKTTKTIIMLGYTLPLIFSIVWALFSLTMYMFTC